MVRLRDSLTLITWRYLGTFLECRCAMNTSPIAEFSENFAVRSGIPAASKNIFKVL